jgi:hypothetical protein
MSEWFEWKSTVNSFDRITIPMISNMFVGYAQKVIIVITY